MAKAYSLIQAVTVGSGGSTSIEFSNIPQNFTDLCLKLSTRSSDASSRLQLFVQYNGSSSNYTGKRLYGEDAGAGSDNLTGTTGGARGYSFGITNGDGSTSSTFSNAEIYIPNYTNNQYKSSSSDTLMENNSSVTFDNWLTANLWSDTSAINKITITLSAGNFKQYSTAYLYGIGGTRATGGTITSDTNYTYHTFTSSGTFIPLEQITGLESLVIAGGGGGAGQPDSGNGVGGGGAGGILYAGGQKVNAGTTYSVVVGSGGSGGTAGTNNGSQGSNSMFSSSVATGGGYGGTVANTGGNGGSGGGGGGTTVGKAGGSGTAGQGYAGGNGTSGFPYVGGGGGGATQAGKNGDENLQRGNGGHGTSTYALWSYATATGVSVNGSYYYGGGGGGGFYFYQTGDGGKGGFGGGGVGGYYNGTALVAPTAGTTNSGGGGGGAGSRDSLGAQAGAAGGSGLVIIRYPNI